MSQGVFIFSEQLRLEAIAYFEKRFKESVTHEQADLYLAQLGELVETFETMADRRRAAPPPAGRAAGSPNPSLDVVPVPSPYPSSDT